MRVTMNVSYYFFVFIFFLVIVILRKMALLFFPVTSSLCTLESMDVCSVETFCLLSSWLNALNGLSRGCVLFGRENDMSERHKERSQNKKKRKRCHSFIVGKHIMFMFSKTLHCGTLHFAENAFCSN